ncbi:hypothetical protein [Botrimarina sp.]|uniref:hypothetical protein n=1 Tax=Botrimarina sp. TaxID=2795802 RepID=UPI0032EBD79E
MVLPLGAAAATPLAQKLARPASGVWRGGALGDALQRVAAVHEVPLWLDRGVDPTRPLRLTARRTTLAGLLNEIADAAGLGACTVGEAVYLGPPEKAAALAARPGRRRASGPLREPRAVHWPRLTTPRDQARQLVQGAGLRLTNPERLPHDLLPAWSAPPAPTADHLSLLLVGFDLTWREARGSRGAVELVDLPPAEPSPAPRLPEPRAATANESDTRYSLRIDQKPLGAVAEQLAAQLGLEFRTDPRLPAGRLGKRITVSVDRATREELLGALGAAGGVSVGVADGVLVITAPP